MLYDIIFLNLIALGRIIKNIIEEEVKQKVTDL